MVYDLYGRAAKRYDWHTPPHHYQEDHAFVLSRLNPPPCRLLDVGCGTGVFLERALDAGYEAIGLDASPEMASIARSRGAPVRFARMQDMKERETYDAIVSLNWSFNYVRSFEDARDVLNRFFIALKPGGRLILQIAHAPNATGQLNEDREPGPALEPDDIVFLYKFQQVHENSGELIAQYVYGCKSLGELLFETHRLNAADANMIGVYASEIGFQNIELLDSWRGHPLDKSVSAFLLAIRR